MKNLADNELIDKALDGQSEAFEVLAERYYTLVCRYAYRWVSMMEDAEDITQDVFIKVAKRLHTFDGRAAFSTWLYRITANCAKDYIRRNRRWSTRGEILPTDERYASSNPGPEARSFHEQIVAAVERLPDKLKEAMLLVYSEGLNHKEAAKVLGCAETTISWRIFQAKRKLKKVLS